MPLGYFFEAAFLARPSRSPPFSIRSSFASTRAVFLQSSVFGPYLFPLNEEILSSCSLSAAVNGSCWFGCQGSPSQNQCSQRRHACQSYYSQRSRQSYISQPFVHDWIPVCALSFSNLQYLGHICFH